MDSRLPDLKGLTPMYSFINALRYINSEWIFDDVSMKTIGDVLEESRFNYITIVENSTNKYYLLNNDILRSTGDLTLGMTRLLLAGISGLIELKEPVDLLSTSYQDISKPLKIGYDYIITEDVPFVISRMGIHKPANKVLKGIHANLTNLGSYDMGYFKVDLPYKTHTLTVNDFNLDNGFKLAKRFNLDTTLLIIGDTLIKVSNLFVDDGSSYRLAPGYVQWFKDLYLNNVNKIQPNTVGLNPVSIRKDVLTDHTTIVKVLTHFNVFLVEYTSDYPLGEYRYKVVNEAIDDYYDDLIVFNNKPSVDKVLHLKNRYMVRKQPRVVYDRNHDDNGFIEVISTGNKVELIDGELFGLDYPSIQYK